MSKTGKIFYAIAFLIFIPFMGVMIQTFRPIMNVQPDEVTQVQGKVIRIEEGSGFDVYIGLENDTHHYYINRGLEYGLNIEDLRTDILGKTVTLYPIKRWTIFTRDGIMGHISKLVVDDRVIFNEIKEEK